MLQSDLADDHQTEGNTDCGKCRGNDCSFALGIKTFLILFAGQQHTDGAVTQPGGHAVKCTSAGKIEYRPHQTDQQGAHKIQKTVVEQQGQQNSGKKEHTDQNRDQIIDDQSAGCIADDEVWTEIKIDHICENKTDHTNHKPEFPDTEETVQFRIFFQNTDSNSLVDDG